MPELGPTDPGSHQPFPPTIDSTAYAIHGVNPGDAIAFILDDEVVVMRPDGGPLPLPAGLCPYARPSVIAELEAQEEHVGCPAS